MKFYPSYSRVAQTLYNNYFRDKIDGFFIECGASDGVSNNNCNFFEDRGWRGINIEPSQRLFSVLIKERNKSYLNLNVALSNTNGTATFKDIITEPGSMAAYDNGSLSHTKAHLKEIASHGAKLFEIKVKTTTYTSLMLQYKIDHVDLLVLDVEGHELPVIEGMRLSTSLPDIICVEFGWAALNDLKCALEGLGYKFDFVRDNNAFFIHKQTVEKF